MSLTRFDFRVPQPSLRVRRTPQRWTERRGCLTRTGTRLSERASGARIPSHRLSRTPADSVAEGSIHAETRRLAACASRSTFKRTTAKSLDASLEITLASLPNADPMPLQTFLAPNIIG